jgi:uncharacterized protein (TIGR02271 family)
MEREQQGDGGTHALQQYEGHEVYDRDGDKIGKVDELFVDENDHIEYMGVKMGLMGLGGSALVPWDAVRVDEGNRRIEVSADKETVKNGPGYDDGQEITPEYEEQVRAHYGLGGGGHQGAAQQHRGAYGDYYDDRDEDFTSSAAAAGVAGGERSETEARGAEARGGTGAHRGEESLTEGRGTGHEREHDHGREGLGAARSADDDDELRVQRSEEELRVGTREHEAGRMNIRKRVRTDREQVRVPKRREEVSVDRVPVNDREASEAEIGEDEFVVPVVEEEVVVDKRPVVKEEVRVRKDVVEDEQVVEEDIRKEEVDIDDQTTTTRGQGRSVDLDDDEIGRRNR